VPQNCVGSLTRFKAQPKIAARWSKVAANDGRITDSVSKRSLRLRHDGRRLQQMMDELQIPEIPEKEIPRWVQVLAAR
jgi:hypothetical protein